MLFAGAMLEQCKRKQKINQELNHKCNPSEVAKGYVQWKNSCHNLPFNHKTCQGNVSSDLILGV